MGRLEVPPDRGSDEAAIRISFYLRRIEARKRVDHRMLISQFQHHGSNVPPDKTVLPATCTPVSATLSCVRSMLTRAPEARAKCAGTESRKRTRARQFVVGFGYCHDRSHQRCGLVSALRGDAASHPELSRHVHSPQSRRRPFHPSLGARARAGGQCDSTLLSPDLRRPGESNPPLQLDGRLAQQAALDQIKRVRWMNQFVAR